MAGGRERGKNQAFSPSPVTCEAAQAHCHISIIVRKTILSPTGEQGCEHKNGKNFQRQFFAQFPWCGRRIDTQVKGCFRNDLAFPFVGGPDWERDMSGFLQREKAKLVEGRPGREEGKVNAGRWPTMHFDGECGCKTDVVQESKPWQWECQYQSLENRASQTWADHTASHQELHTHEATPGNSPPGCLVP